MYFNWIFFIPFPAPCPEKEGPAGSRLGGQGQGDCHAFLV